MSTLRSRVCPCLRGARAVPDSRWLVTPRDQSLACTRQHRWCTQRTGPCGSGTPRRPRQHSPPLARQRVVCGPPSRVWHDSGEAAMALRGTYPGRRGGGVGAMPRACERGSEFPVVGVPAAVPAVPARLELRGAHTHQASSTGSGTSTCVVVRVSGLVARAPRPWREAKQITDRPRYRNSTGGVAVKVRERVLSQRHPCGWIQPTGIPKVPATRARACTLAATPLRGGRESAMSPTNPGIPPAGQPVNPLSHSSGRPWHDTRVCPHPLTPRARAPDVGTC